MSVWRLVVKEILHRKLNFGLAVGSVCIGVACLVGALTLLEVHDLRTERVVAQKEARTKAAMKKLEDDYRIITKKMGFNILILPRGQNLGDLYAEDYASKYMPEEYVHTLANSSILTVRHLLPSLQQKLKWPERGRTIILIGTRREVPVAHRTPKTPVLEPVPAGSMVVGHELHRSLNISAGEKVRLLDREFTVGKLLEERGNKDDITIWINLKEAQELLDKEGKINGILALECRCAWADLAKIREEVSRILPETQVIEKAGIALARAEARSTAAEAAKRAVEAEKLNRAELRREKEALAEVLVPVAVVAAAALVGVLALFNARERRSEIGILRAIGLRSWQILTVFLARACLVGLAGSVPGYFIGRALGVWWEVLPEGAGAAPALLDPWLLTAVVIAAPLVAGLAAWLPALSAAGRDPAEVLREA